MTDTHFGLVGKVAIVTGGASGIGRATALLFAEYGARVAVADRQGEEAEKTAATIREKGGEAFAECVDITSSDDFAAFVAATAARFGRLDCAANMAGATVPKAGVLATTEDSWSKALDINLSGMFHCVRHEAAAMRQTGGAIVNCSSIGGLIGSGVQPAYAAAKHGVIGLTKSAAIELGAHDIRVNAVCPGIIRTAMTEANFGDRIDEIAMRSNPLRRAGTAHEVASATVWLCSDASSFVNGTTLVVDGGGLAGVSL